MQPPQRTPPIVEVRPVQVGVARRADSARVRVTAAIGVRHRRVGDLPWLPPAARPGVVLAQHDPPLPGTTVPPHQEQRPHRRCGEVWIADPLDRAPGPQLTLHRAEQRRRPRCARRVRRGSRCGDAVVQLVAVVVEGQVNRAVVGADTHHRHVVIVVALKPVIVEADPLPLPTRQTPACHRQAALSIVVRRVLPATKGRERVLLIALPVDEPSPLAHYRDARVHPALGDLAQTWPALPRQPQRLYAVHEREDRRARTGPDYGT